MSARAGGEGGGDAEAQSGARTVLVPRQKRRVARRLSSSVSPGPWTLVGHGKSMAGRALVDGDRDGAPSRGGTQCVVERVVEDLLDGAWHGADEDRRLCASEHKVHLSEFRCRAPGVDPVSGGACEIHGDRRPALVRACELQQIGDEAGQSFCPAMAASSSASDDGPRVWKFSRRSRNAVSGVRS